MSPFIKYPKPLEKGFGYLDTRTHAHTHSSAYLSDPGAQQADADLAVVVEVGVEPPGALGQVAEERRHGGVDVGQLDVEQEEAVLVRGPRRTLDQSREQVLVKGEGGERRGYPRYVQVVKK